MDLIAVKQRFGIIGSSEAMDRALEIALRVAPTDLSVLVTGESGVGKEFFPQVIHAYSARKHNKYIAVNCGAIPEGTIDSELFGHEKGSFTGATESRKGYFEEADGGTIFLDEVAELPHSTQVRLLRVLQRRVHPCRFIEDAEDERTRRGGDQHQPADGHQGGTLPGRPLLPAQHGTDICSRPARTQGGYLHPVP